MAKNKIKMGCVIIPHASPRRASQSDSIYLSIYLPTCQYYGRQSAAQVARGIVLALEEVVALVYGVEEEVGVPHTE